MLRFRHGLTSCVAAMKLSPQFGISETCIGLGTGFHSVSWPPQRTGVPDSCVLLVQTNDIRLIVGVLGRRSRYQSIMPNLHSLPEDSRPNKAIRNNGPDNLALERFKLRELAEGWPMYRDACEWENFESIFHPDAHIYTTWSGRVHYQKFFEISKEGMDKGAFIMHRCNGASTDIAPEGDRAVTKLKAVITQRFMIEECEVDVEADCRFCYFWERDSAGAWRARLVRHWYEKDKMIPVNPNKIPKLDEVRLAQYSPGYRMLAYCQEATMEGVKVLYGLPGHLREEKGNPSRMAHDKLYVQCKKWLDGDKIRPEDF